MTSRVRTLRLPADQRAYEAFAIARYALGLDMAKSLFYGRNKLMPIAGGGETALRRLQAGLETTRLVAVPATRKVYGNGLIGRTQPPVRPSEEDRGTFIRNYRSQPGLIEATLPFRASATFEDTPWWCQLGIKGGVTGVLQNTTAYKYDFVPSASSDDVKTATFEQGDDTQAWQMAGGFVDSFSITGALRQPWLFEATVWGADKTPITFTVIAGERVVEDIETHLTKLAIGNAGAVPAGFLTGRVIGFKLTVNNHGARKFFMDGLTTPTESGYGRGEREITLEVTWEGNAATVAEHALWVSGTSRVVRLQALGSTIAGSSPTVAKTAEIVVAGKWASFVPGNRDTNSIFTAVLEAEYDATLGYDLDMFVINALSVLP